MNGKNSWTSIRLSGVTSMTKKEYLTELRKNLCGLPEKDIDDRISFYEEAIDDRISDGKSEEEAIADIGTIDDVVKQIAQETPFKKIVKEKIKPKRRLRGWEIALIIIGFPLWLPILIVAFVMTLVGIILLWVLTIVSYAVETAFAAGSIATFVAFIGSAVYSEPNFLALGASVALFGAACLFVFACIGSTKLNILITKSIFLGIKKSIISGGNK